MNRFLHADEGENTAEISQFDIVDSVDITSAQKVRLTFMHFLPSSLPPFLPSLFHSLFHSFGVLIKTMK